MAVSVAVDLASFVITQFRATPSPHSYPVLLYRDQCTLIIFALALASDSKRPGDFRAAQAPFLAHRHYGASYKWMLYGEAVCLQADAVQGGRRVC